MIVLPEALDAPVTPPVIFPIVHEKLLATLDVKAILGLVPPQVFAVAKLVIAGNGFTVIVNEEVAPLPQILFPLTVIKPETEDVE